MIKPLLIDKRLDNFYLKENETVLINVEEINLIECRQATLKYKEESQDQEQEQVSKNDILPQNNEENSNIEQESALMSNAPVVDNENFVELDGWSITVYTKSSPIERFSFFSTNPDFEWLKRNCNNIGLSKLHETENSIAYVNKKNIIDMRFIKKDIENADLIFYFKTTPINIENGFDNIISYPLEMSNIKEDLRNENAYTIIKEFLDSI